MTLLLPNIFYFVCKTFVITLNITECVFKYLDQDFSTEFFGWIGYTLIPLIVTTIGHASSFIHDILSIPIYFWNLLWHPNGHSIIDMQQKPEGNECFILLKKHIFIDGENKLDPCHDGCGNKNHSDSDFNGQEFLQMRTKLLSEAAIPDYACFHYIKYIQQALKQD